MIRDRTDCLPRPKNAPGSEASNAPKRNRRAASIRHAPNQTTGGKEPNAGMLRPNAGRPLDSMFATSEARAQPRGARQAAGELAYRECLSQAAANPKDAGPPPDDTTIRAVVGLPAGLLIVAVIAAYLAIHIRATYLPP